MADKPYPTGTMCVVIVDPTGEHLGDAFRIASQRTVIVGPKMLSDPRVVHAARGLVAQNVEVSPEQCVALGIPTALAAAGFYPIRWMVPRDVNPDPEMADTDREVSA